MTVQYKCAKEAIRQCDSFQECERVGDKIKKFFKKSPLLPKAQIRFKKKKAELLRCGKIQATQETRVLSLDWEDPLEKGMASQSSILAWRIHGQTMGSQRVGHDFSLSLILFTFKAQANAASNWSR